jgi:hypothetical protein
MIEGHNGIDIKSENIQEMQIRMRNIRKSLQHLIFTWEYEKINLNDELRIKNEYSKNRKELDKLKELEK